MPITINGSGTVTGISAGGLPDDCITTDDIAANAVTAAKLGADQASGLAKAFVNFNGTGTVAIRASFNVSSITDNGTGDYTVNFTTAMTDTNYSVSGNLMANIAPGNNMRCLVIYPNTTYSTAFAVGSLRVLAQDYAGGVADPLAATVSIFR
jgi:hypothetical protein